MPGVRSNTIYECLSCGAKYDFEDIKLATEPCQHCGSRQYHQLVVVPVCDFCSEPIEEEDAWTFPCDKFEYPISIPGFPDGGSIGDWAACDECANIILAGSPHELARRSANHDIIRDPSAAEHYHFLYAMAKQIQKGFFANRTGDPYKGPPPERRAKRDG